jgi:hypothetical protein
MFQVSSPGAWLLDGRLYKSLRIGLVSLRVCSGPQQTRYFAWIIAFAEILTDVPVRTYLLHVIFRCLPAFRADLWHLLVPSAAAALAIGPPFPSSDASCF